MSRSVQPSAPPEMPPARSPSPIEGLLLELRTRRRGRGSALGASFSSALEALWANRTRSLLTTLGIFIGVAAVIGALTLTQGASAYINSFITSLGSNTIIVMPGSSNNRGVITRLAKSTLTPFDVQSLARVPHLTGVSPIIAVSGQVVYADQNWKTSIQGVSTDLQNIQNWQLAQGLWFSSTDDAGEKSVAVIGDTVAQHLFGPSNTNPVGQTIRIRNQLFRVVGVLAPQGGGFNEDDVIFVPFHTALARLTNLATVNYIEVQVDSADNVTLAQEGITGIIEQNHHLPRGGPDDFQTVSSTELLQQAQQASQILTILLVGIAAISLTVGGIGIMNIMLVSVTQRTREIGIRMAIGARRADIRNQFLIEALALCLVGGIIGLLLGLLVGFAMTTGFGLPFVITPATLLVPFAVSASVAIAFGLYPAIRASRLDPIVALRRAK